MDSPKTKTLDFVQNNLILAIIAIAVVVVERIVKYYITEKLQVGESIPVLGNFLMITRSENIGAGFGILKGQNWLFIGAAIIAIILIMYFYNEIIKDKLLVFISAFILGGTVGNMMDRLFFGRVIDYIDFSFWPTFNLSDASLTIGFALLIIYMYRWHKKEEKYVRY